MPHYVATGHWVLDYSEVFLYNKGKR